jgi:hypothetical protein
MPDIVPRGGGKRAKQTDKKQKDGEIFQHLKVSPESSGKILARDMELEKAAAPVFFSARRFAKICQPSD